MSTQGTSSICVLHATIIIVYNVTACFHGDVQLVNYHNIVEFCYKGKWRRICRSDDWDSVEANIVCSQLGYNNQSKSKAYITLILMSATMKLALTVANTATDKHATVQCSSGKHSFIHYESDIIMIAKHS